MFLQVKICVLARVGKSFAKCLFELSILKILVQKSDIGSYIWHRSFKW